MKKAPAGLRNGLKWRDGRPRWEPSPASRVLGIKGRDLKDLHGRFVLDRGKAISMADARYDWSVIYRKATSGDAIGREAREDLRAVLAELSDPSDDDGRLMRANVADLIEKCRALIENRTEVFVPATAARTVDDLIAAYFADPPDEISQGTIKAYLKWSKRFAAKFGTKEVASITRPMMYQWYQELKKTNSLSTSNAVIATAAALFRWGTRHEGWNTESPATKLGLSRPAGRIVIWPFQLEMSFVKWCDANGYADVADAVVFGCWTSARQVDMVRASIGDLMKPTWRFTPQKTRRRAVEAVPSILPALRARVDRRWADVAGDGVTYLNPSQAPFLFNPNSRMPHDSDSIGQAFIRAKTFAAAAHKKGQADLPGIEGLKLSDTRDTCVTRLAASEVPLDQIPAWTGHSDATARTILREHYMSLLEEGSLRNAEKLANYAERQGFAV